MKDERYNIIFFKIPFSKYYLGWDKIWDELALFERKWIGHPVPYLNRHEFVRKEK